MDARRDAEYLDAVRCGDLETAQRMVAESARVAGYTIGPAYRAENAGRGVMTDAIIGGIYFFDNEPQAARWAGECGHVISAFIKPGLLKDVAESEGNLDRGISGKDPLTGLEGRDADTIIRRFPDDENRGIAEIVVFSRSQITSAEAVTYDEAGNVVPLSARFDLDASYLVAVESMEEAQRMVEEEERGMPL